MSIVVHVSGTFILLRRSQPDPASGRIEYSDLVSLTIDEATRLMVDMVPAIELAKSRRLKENQAALVSAQKALVEARERVASLERRVEELMP